MAEPDKPAPPAPASVHSGPDSSALKRVASAILERLVPGRRVRRAFVGQAEHCERMGSPFTALLCRLAAKRLDTRDTVGAAILGWPSHPGNDALPLRFAGALHALVLSGRAPKLAALYPPHKLPPADQLWATVLETMAAESDFILATLRSPPQTNEVGRSAILLGGFLEIAAATRLKLVTSELGASAGLNMFWDRFAYELNGVTWGNPASAVRLAPRWTGKLPPLTAPVTVKARAGCDLNRLDARNPEHRLRLLSYVWADQNQRIQRLSAALDVAAADPPDIATADAADWIEARVAAQPEGTAHVVYHTIVWQYLPLATRERISAALYRAGAATTATRTLAWLRFEADGKEPGGVLTLTSWPGGETRILARADYHGAWVDWAG